MPAHPRIPRDQGPATREVMTKRDIGGWDEEMDTPRIHYSRMSQKQEALAALRQDPRIHRDFGFPLVDDPDILFEAARLSGNPERVLAYMPPELRKDREWLLKMAKTNIWTLNCVPDEILKDPKFMTEVAMAFPPLLDDPKFKPRKQELLDASPALKERYETVKKACAELHIDDPMRLRSAALLDEVVHNRQSARAANDSRPTAVVVYAKQDTDHNDSLKGHNIDELTKHYRVMFYEARTEQDFINAVCDGGKDGKAALVAVDGHGTRSEMNLGDAVYRGDQAKHEENRLDIGDEAQFRAAGLEKFVEPNATILLEACSNGADKASGDNPANMFARIFPGRDVYAPDRPVEIIRIDLDEKGQVRGPSWTGQDDATYKAHVDPGAAPVVPAAPAVAAAAPGRAAPAASDLKPVPA